MTFPVVTPAGTLAMMEVVLQLPIIVAVPLNVAVLVPCVEPKFVPVIVTDAPVTPDVGDTLVMLGVGSTVKEEPLLAKRVGIGIFEDHQIGATAQHRRENDSIDTASQQIFPDAL
jgi:hypothetical protein